jgi:hypothetical protein
MGRHFMGDGVCIMKECAYSSCLRRYTFKFQQVCPSYTYRSIESNYVHRLISSHLQLIQSLQTTYEPIVKFCALSSVESSASVIDVLFAVVVVP